MRKRRIMIGIFITLSAVALTVSLIVLSNPLRWPEKSINAKMLKLTPIGTSIEDVISVVENNSKWEMSAVRNYGYTFVHGRPSRAGTMYDDSVVGVKSVYVYLGEYRTIFATDVTVFYAFDEDSELIDIAVLKEKDSM